MNIALGMNKFKAVLLNIFGLTGLKLLETGI